MLKKNFCYSVVVHVWVLQSFTSTMYTAVPGKVGGVSKIFSGEYSSLEMQYNHMVLNE